MTDLKRLKELAEKHDFSFFMSDKHGLPTWKTFNGKELVSLIARLEIYEAALTNIRSDLSCLLDGHELPNLLADSLNEVCKALQEGKKV